MPEGCRLTMNGEGGSRHHLKAKLQTLGLALAFALLWGAAMAFGQALPPLALSVALFAGLVGLAWFDFDHYRIPNWISYPLIAIGLALAWAQGMRVLVWHGLAAVIGYGLIWSLNFYWQKRHGKDGMGMGDAKLLAAAGAWLGPLSLPFVTLIASGAALSVIGVSSVFGKGVGRDTRIPFGPYIALGFWSLWLFGQVLVG